MRVMTFHVSDVNWLETNAALADCLKRVNESIAYPIDQGLEAHVVRLSIGEQNFVMKIWNKVSNPDVRFQFHLLYMLCDAGLPVSLPVAWGINLDGHGVLLTTFDGEPFQRVDGLKMATIATILARIHQFPVREFTEPSLPRHDFTAYFLPGIEEHDDLHRVLISILRETEVRQDGLIHGDFHLANMVEQDGRITVIDWTNAQMGDARFDFAWSFTLQRLFMAEESAQDFKSAYLALHSLSETELEGWEALACLRWILLWRSGGIPLAQSRMDRVTRILAGNRYVSQVVVDAVNHDR